MTVLNLCHSEEAQRADVGIRPFYNGRKTGGRAAEVVGPYGCGVGSAQQRADVVIGPYGTKRESAATAGAALSEAESAERGAGQIQSLPDTLRVQHGAQRPEV